MLSGTVVLKENHLQLVTDELGDIPSGNAGGLGLYYYDTRYLSAFELLVNGVRPLYLSHSAERNYVGTFQFVNPQMVLPSGVTVPRQTISIRRTRFVDGKAFHERLGLYNCNHFPVDLDVTLRFDADFRDIFAVRGFALQRLAGRTSSEYGSDQLVFSYVGRDRVMRRLNVHFSKQPEPVSANTMLFRLHLDPHVPLSITMRLQPSVGRKRVSKLANFDEAVDRVAERYTSWHQECTVVETDNEYFDRSLLRQSRFDIRTLLEFNEVTGAGQNGNGGRKGQVEMVPTAGIPWYAVPFGRDAIITAIQTLMYNPRIAEGTLRFLARHQGREVNERTEEEPGKIFHELRRGELASLREIPHVPYYGTADATPLFVVLFVETMAWLGSESLYRDMLPHALRALEWVDGFGDMDGDGYIEYIPRGQGGVRNQGWKDSFDSLQYEDGQLASLPAALVEVQGYVYQAKMGLAALARSHGDMPLASRLEAEAKTLRDRFNQDFWMPEEQFFAQALDKAKSPIRSITSNVGHCLWSGIVEPDKAAKVVERLMAPDMFSGWGIRTLSSASPNYNPMSYHNGSVWPHDCSLIALGMCRYGYPDEAAAVINGIIEAGLRFPTSRLPELFCGYARDRRFHSSPMSYIKSCSPQAWAAAAPYLFLQTLLGLRPDAGGRILWVEPVPSGIFGKYQVSGLCTGAGRVNFQARKDGGDMRVHLDVGDVRLCSESARVET